MKLGIKIGLLGIVSMITIQSRVLAGGTVTSCDEASLRAALAGGGTVTFACDGTIALANTLAITNNTALDAGGHSITLSGGNAVGVFTVNGVNTLSLFNLTIANGLALGTNAVPGTTGGSGEGGGVLLNGGTLIASNCLFQSNVAEGGNCTPPDGSGNGGDGLGGAIYINNGCLSIFNCNFVSNQGRGGAGAINASECPLHGGGNAGNGYGGAIYCANSVVQMVNCQFNNNQTIGPDATTAVLCGVSSGGAYGGAVFESGGTVTNINGSFVGNQASASLISHWRTTGRPGQGGACYNSGGTLVVSGTSFTSCMAAGGHGNCDGTSSGSGQGGAVFSTGSLQVSNCNFGYNQANGGNFGANSGGSDGSGGAIFCTGPSSIQQSWFFGNVVLGGYGEYNCMPYYVASGLGRGGAIYNSSTGSIVGCTFSTNQAFGSSDVYNALPSAGYGGAIYNTSFCQLTNSTLTGNLAQGGNGAAGVGGANAFGGAIYNASGSVIAVNNTFASNAAVGATGSPNGTGYGAAIYNSSGTVNLYNTIVANSTSGSNCWGTISDSGYNLSSDNSAGFPAPGSLNNTDPKLGSLGNYGGLTPTIPLLSNSPAIDDGGSSGAPSTDQRGFVRPIGDGVDMGAYEYEYGSHQPITRYSLTVSAQGFGTVTKNPTNSTYPAGVNVAITATPGAGWVFADWSGDTNSSLNPLLLTLNTNLSLTGTFAQLPAFDLQPLSVTNVAGSTVSFSAHAVGNTSLGYQWFFSGGSLDGATNTTLTLTNVSSGQAGNYWIVATNSYGSATSYVASLMLTNVSGSTNVVYSADEASLRAAIKIGGWVSLAFSGTITITNTINITNDVILDGRNVSATISGGSAVRLFYVAPGVTFCATNLTLANGSCIVTNGTAGTPADAGAIYNNGGSVTLVSCTLTNNSAQSLINGGLARGGAIFNNSGSVSLFQSAILNNAVIGGGAGTALGGAIFNTNGSMTISGCEVSSNFCKGLAQQYTASLAIGGAAFQASGSLTITNSVFKSNLALGDGASMTGAPSTPAYGGALAANGGSLTIDHSQLYGNTARGGDAGFHGTGGLAFGGAIYSAATLIVNDSSFSGNQSLAGNNTYNFGILSQRGADGCGGAVYNLGSAVFNRCSVYYNYTQGGSAYGAGPSGPANGGYGMCGGIFNASQFAATNCTIALNTAAGGNGSYNYYSGNAMGGGVFNNTNATFIAMNLTIASNSCSSPNLYSSSGIAAGTQIANSNGTLRLHNSIIAYGDTNGNACGTITDDGYNLSSDASAGFSAPGSLNNTDPKLGSLGNYGGPTPTMVLLAGSPAIDLGDSSGAPSTDQRGFVRPYGNGVDEGAYEYGSYRPSPPEGVPGCLDIAATANCVLISFTGTPAGAYRLQASTNLSTWTDLSTNGPFASSTNITQTANRQGFNHCFFRMLVQ